MRSDEETRIEYRAVALRDLDALQALHTELNASEANPFTALASSGGQVAFELKRVRKALMASERYVCVVASQGDQLVGYCAGTIEQAPPIFQLTHYGTVAELYVLPQVRRRGVARELLRRVLSGMASRGVTMVEATASVTQSEGRALLEASGFVARSVQFSVELSAADAEAEEG